MITKKAWFMQMLVHVSVLMVACHNSQFANGNNSKTDSPKVFVVSRDTIHLNIEGLLSKALLIHDKYYAFYEVRDPSSTQSIKKFYIIEKGGKIEKVIKVPEGIQDEYYYSLYYWHGHIIVNTEFYKSTFFLEEEKGEFVKNREVVKVPLFEDENYQVTTECKGEWGSTIYFKNKSTGITYSDGSGCPFLVNKIGDKYFVNTSGMIRDDIMEIKDPAKIDATTKTIFSNDNFRRNFNIPTSFVANGVLFHIYNSYKNEFRIDEKKERIVVTKDSAEIGIINKGEFKPVYTFKDKFDVQLEQQLSPDYQICTFHTESRIQIGFKKDIPPYMEAKYGFIEIKGNVIKIHYFFSQKAG